ncbi:MAG: hypothetical protein PHC63_07560 [Candidatus Bathyarchaeota archaeon]|nr:hypothetical protein [Candidatus Bathyarchaeota archaeon]MDI9578108.1 hypothetical protein [Thermoproteota archaeon]NLD67079.1 hypothetical protein [Thermoproteota archaeon]
MQIEDSGKLTKANVIIAYEISSKNTKEKTRFHNELYGRNNDGLLFRIPHRKLANCVIEIPQRNLQDIRSVFNKYGIKHQLRIAIPERNPDKIVKITESIEDVYEKALNYDSVAFSLFLLDKFEKASDPALDKEDLEDELLAITDTVEKWFKKHSDAPLSTGFAYIFKALEVTNGKSPEIIRRDISRIKESLKNWVIGYQVLNESKDSDSIDDLLKRYKTQKV